MSMTSFFLNASAFLMAKYFPVMSEMIGMYGCLTFMSTACIFGIIFVAFVMEETKGKNLDPIGRATTTTTTTTAPASNQKV